MDECTDLEDYISTINFEGRIFDTPMKKVGGVSNGNGLEREDMEFLDLFVANYKAEVSIEDAEGEGGAATATTMDWLTPHRDGYLLSLTILLRPLSEFEGGGTTFYALSDHHNERDDNDNVVIVRRNDEKYDNGDNDDGDNEDYNHNAQILHPGGCERPPREGYGTIHCGKLLHGADIITSDTRTVMVAFVDVLPLVQRPGPLLETC